MDVCETSALLINVGVSKEEHYISSWYYGPFEILEKVGDVAYRLNLPESTPIHPMFHVLVLKKKLGQTHNSLSQLPPIDAKGIIRPELKVILDW